MKFKKGLIKSDLKKLRKKEWYHQRFDGCPNLLYLTGEMELKPEPRKMKGGEERKHVVIFSDDKTDYYADQADFKRITNLFVKRCNRESDIGKRTMIKWDKDKIKFIEFCQDLENIKLATLSDQKLYCLYKKFIDCYFRWVTMSSVIDGFALGSDAIIQERIKNFLDRKRIKKGQGKIFSQLTAPASLSFINESELSLLRVARLVSKNKKLRQIFIEKKVSEIWQKLKDFPKEYELLLGHQKNYFWSKNNYVNNYILTPKYFIKEIKALLGSSIDIASQIKRIESAPAINRRIKKQILKRLKPPKDIKNLIEISETFTYWQDERKKYTLWTTHYGSIFLQEIGKRFGYSLNEMKYMFAVEVLALFSKNSHRVSKQEARARRIFSLIYHCRNHYEMVFGRKSKEIAKMLFTSNIKKNINDFRGLSASSGKVRGIVKVVRSAHEVGKINQGDILVAVMTRPDYIMGIKKAAAIVTDEGGVTSHAAIVAREFGIPCVIGTKIATVVLKDGDLVEVNGNHGVITILKRK
jgi:phosphohistidine swiveling domain-containing protein